MGAAFGKDLTEGSIPRHLLLFSIPMLAGNALQIGYSLINTIWVGHLIGENAVGAVGVSLPVLYVLFGFAMGMSIATTIVVSQYYGAKDYGMVEKAVANAFSLCLIIGSVLTIAAVLLSDHLLRLMATPPENFGMASTYLRLNLAAFILFYFGMLANFILRGIGDTLTPLVFMSVGLGLNAVLDPFLIGGFGHTMVTMISSLLSQWLLRVPVSWLLSKTSLGVNGIWVAVALSFVATMVASLVYYFSGRWKVSTVIKAPPLLPVVE